MNQAISSKWAKGSSGPAGDEHHNLTIHALTSEGHDASEDGTGRGTPIVPTLRGFGHGWQGQHNDDVSKAGLVRRLTPLECERLQGFPDGWTCLCQPMESYRDNPDDAAMRCKCPDSPRYRALGNAVTVNVIEWIGKRLERRKASAKETRWLT